MVTAVAGALSLFVPTMKSVIFKFDKPAQLTIKGSGGDKRYASDASLFPNIQETGRKAFHGYLAQIDHLLQGRQWLCDQYSVLDPYAAESAGEFFAVASEGFFETPELLAPAYPAVYEQLRLFYRQDPAARLGV